MLEHAAFQLKWLQATDLRTRFEMRQCFLQPEETDDSFIDRVWFSIESHFLSVRQAPCPERHLLGHNYISILCASSTTYAFPEVCLADDLKQPRLIVTFCILNKRNIHALANSLTLSDIGHRVHANLSLRKSLERPIFCQFTRVHLAE